MIEFGNDSKIIEYGDSTKYNETTDMFILDDNFDEYKQRMTDNYYKSEKLKTQLIGYSIVPAKPDIGYFFTINGIDIPKSIFKEEFNKISEIYFNVINKIKNYER